MGILGKRFKLISLHGNIGKLSIIAFLITISLALIDTIWAVYLESFLQNEAYVGFFSGMLTFISFFSFFLIIPLIEKRKKEALVSFGLIVLIVSYILFSFVKSFLFISLIAIAAIIALNIKVSSFGIIVRDKSKRNKLSRNEGILYTVYNLGWVIGPLIAGYIASKFGFSFVFLTASLILLFSLIVLNYFKISDHKVKKRVDSNLFRNFIEFFSNKERLVAYFLGGGANFWWVLIYLFMPLYLNDKGIGIDKISIFLFVVLIPNVLFSYFFAVKASKIGFKKVFIVGYLILALTTFFCFFIENIFIIVALLVLATVGISMIEPTTEAYFLDLMKGNEAYHFYAPYNTTIDVNSFIAKIVPSLFLLFLPFKFVFLVFSIFMLGFVILSLFSKNIIESRRRRDWY